MPERGPEVFLQDLQEHPELLAELRGLVPNVDAGHAWAWAKGYAITREFLEGLFESYQELADEDLEQAAGGWSGDTNTDPPPPPPPPPTGG